MFAEKAIVLRLKRIMCMHGTLLFIRRTFVRCSRVMSRNAPVRVFRVYCKNRSVKIHLQMCPKGETRLN